jgi:hypothetical protein
MTEDEFDNLLNDDPNQWLDCLPAYQKTSVQELLAKNSADEVAAKWLTASFASTFAFGAQVNPNSSVFREKLKEELEAFLCGSPKYNAERKQFLSLSKDGRTYLVGALSVAIAPHLGASAVFLAPAIILLLYSFGKVSIRAWCSVQEQARSKSSPAK